MKSGDVSLVMLSLSVWGSYTAVASKAQFPFKYFAYEPLMNQFHTLNEEYPEYVDFISVQEKYGLPYMGDCGSKKCEVFYARITHEASLMQEFGDMRPEVFLSGALHGNERVGPTTVYETARMLVVMASCVDKATHKSIEDASLCENILDAKSEAMLAGGSNNDRESAKLLRRKRLLWIHRLVHTRSIYIMPTANAFGYFQNKREEGRIDPNRDFPFVQSRDQCFQTVAARSMNELFREHMFQISITFHGGLQALAYEWGTPIHPKAGRKDTSPDDHSQSQIASSMSDFCGKGRYSSNRQYPFKPMNSLVYPVHGGMEDWGYGASWDLHEPGKDNVKTVPKCRVSEKSNGVIKPKLRGGGEGSDGDIGVEYGGYPSDKTDYTDSMFRSYVLLVETSDAKTPPESTLGSASGLFLPKASDEEGNGHLARNVRLSLEGIDLLEPYLEWDFDVMKKDYQLSSSKSSSKSSSSGVVAIDAWQPFPQSSVDEAYHDGVNNPGGWLWTASVTVKDPSSSSKKSSKSEPLPKVRVSWRVGGGLHVDQTYLKVGCWPSQAAIPSTTSSDLNQRSLKHTKSNPSSSSSSSSSSVLSSSNEKDPLYQGPQQFWQAVIEDRTSPSSSTSGEARWAKPGATFADQYAYSSHDDGNGETSQALGRSSSSQPFVTGVIRAEEGVDGDLFHGWVGGWSECGPGGMYVMAVAKVDESWGVLPKGSQPVESSHPESHLANARTNSKWRHELKEHVIQGRDLWHSPPIHIATPEQQLQTSSEGNRVSRLTFETEALVGKKKLVRRSEGSSVLDQVLTDKEKVMWDKKTHMNTPPAFERQSSQVMDDPKEEATKKQGDATLLEDGEEDVKVERVSPMTYTILKVLACLVCFRCIVAGGSAMLVKKISRSERFDYLRNN